MNEIILNSKVNLNILIDKYGFTYNPLNGSDDDMECYIYNCDKYSVRIYTVGLVMVKYKEFQNIYQWYELYEDLVKFKEISELIKDNILIVKRVED